MQLLFLEKLLCSPQQCVHLSGNSRENQIQWFFLCSPSDSKCWNSIWIAWLCTNFSSFCCKRQIEAFCVFFFIWKFLHNWAVAFSRSNWICPWLKQHKNGKRSDAFFFWIKLSFPPFSRKQSDGCIEHQAEVFWNRFRCNDFGLVARMQSILKHNSSKDPSADKEPMKVGCLLCQKTNVCCNESKASVLVKKATLSIDGEILFAGFMHNKLCWFGECWMISTKETCLWWNSSVY